MPYLQRSPMTSGIFIAFEGIDGAGKTTQVNLLRDALREAGESPVVSKEPTDGHWGQLLRRSASQGRLPLEEELQAFINDRTEHVSTLIRPSLEAGRIVILDRYFYSTIAYQGSRGGDVESIKNMMESRFPLPDLVILVDTEPAVSLRRISQSRGETPNAFEQIEPLSRARSVFNSIESPNIVKVDGHQPPEAIHRAIIQSFTEGVLRASRCAKSYGCENEFECGFRLTNNCDWFRLSSKLRSERIVA